MSFTVADCPEVVKLELGGPAGPALPTLELVNMAGLHLCGMSSWRFLKRKVSARDTVAAQTYITVPADFGSLIELVSIGTNSLYSESDYASIVRERSALSAGSTGGAYLYAIIDLPASGSTPAVRHIELSPTPVASVTGAVNLVYRAIWANLTSDNDFIPIPDYCKTLFWQIIMAHAGGFRRKETASLSKRLGELATSAVFMAAVKNDRAFQPDIGAMEGSITDCAIDRGRQIFSGVINGP